MPVTKSTQGLIAVAVSLDDPKPALEAAGQLALKANMGLHVVHIARPPIVGLATSPLSLAYIGEDTLRLIEGESVLEAESKLREVTAELPKSLKVTTNVIVARSVPEAVMAEATVVGANLIICGAGKGNYRFVPQGFSTALSLMANSNIPVLAVKDEVPVHLNNDSLTVVVADDLREAGGAALNYVMRWAQQMSGVDIHHLHVHGMTRSQFETSIYTSMATMQVPLNADIDVKGMYDALIKEIEDKLKKHKKEIEPLIGNLAGKGHYYAHLETGGVIDKIAEMAEQHHANILVFGRHNTLHHKPFGVGTIPYRLMLQQKAPVLVVPTC